MDIAIPETLDDLTPAWLTSALRTAGELGDGEVVAVTQETLGEGEGFLGDVARLRLTYRDGDGPATLVAKLPKLANRAMGELLGAYERESCFYDELADDLPLATPRLYYGDFDRDASSERQATILALADRTPRRLTSRMTELGKWVAARKKRRYVLLIEDLEDTTPGDQVAGVSTERCAEVLKSIAAMHAAYWESPKLDDRFWLLPLGIDARMRHGLFCESQDAFRKRFGHFLSADMGRTLAWAERGGVAAMRALEGAPGPTLLHCDLRLDNIVFRGDEPVVFDWQLARRGPAAYDVAYFLSGAHAELSREDERALLEGYLAALHEHGIRGYEFAAFERDYRLALLVVLQTLATADQVELGEGRGVALMDAWLQRLQDRLDGVDPAALVAGAAA